MLIVRWLLFIAFAAFLSRDRKHPKKKLDGSENGADPAHGKQPSRPPGPAYEQGWHPQEEKHRRHEGRYWLASILLSAIVAIGAGLSAIYAYAAVKAANEQARIAKQAFVAGDRPWIQTSGFTVNYANIGSNYFTVSTGVTLKNVGHSPALDVSLFTEVKANSLQYGDMTNGLASVCSRAKEAKREAVFTNIIFPGEETALSEREIVFVVTAARIAGEIGNDRDKAVYLNVCATYSGPTDDQFHGTSFGLRIAPKCKNEREPCAFNWDRPNVIAQDRLDIKTPSSGRTAE